MTYNKDGIQGAFIQRPAPKPWVGCITKGFNECRDENEDCVGQEKTNFVYGFYNSKRFWGTTVLNLFKYV